MSTILIGIGLLLVALAVICLVIERKTIEHLVAEEIKRIEGRIEGEIKKEIEFIKGDMDVVFTRLQAIKNKAPKPPKK